MPIIVPKTPYEQFVDYHKDTSRDALLKRLFNVERALVKADKEISDKNWRRDQELGHVMMGR